MAHWVHAALAGEAILIATSVHHAYGAMIYRAAFRGHVALGAIPLMLLLPTLLFLGSRPSRTRLHRLALSGGVLLMAVLVLGLGLFEGGYNHFLKNVLYFSGTPGDTMARLYPSPPYEMPNDWFFEVTGVLQFFLGLFAGRYTYCLFRGTR
jgi:hypothetical protein